MPGEVTHSMWTEVCVSYNCATVPARPARRCHPGCHPYSPGLGGSGLLPRHDLMPSPVDTRLLAHVVPGARSFRLATGLPNAISAYGRPMDGTAPGTAGSCASANQRRSESPPSHPVKDAGDLWAEEPAGPVSPPAAGSHCLNRLPVHRSVLVAGRHRQAAGSEPTVHISYAPEWPGFPAGFAEPPTRPPSHTAAGHH